MEEGRGEAGPTNLVAQRPLGWLRSFLVANAVLRAGGAVRREQEQEQEEQEQEEDQEEERRSVNSDLLAVNPELDSRMGVGQRLLYSIGC